MLAYIYMLWFSRLQKLCEKELEIVLSFIVQTNIFLTDV